jgi:hypothetical protein
MAQQKKKKSLYTEGYTDGISSFCNGKIAKTVSELISEHNGKMVWNPINPNTTEFVFLIKLKEVELFIKPTAQ